MIKPSRDLPAGLDKAWQLCLAWLEYSRTRVFPGGCFFFAVAAEFDAQPGRVRDKIVKSSIRWTQFVERTLEDARDAGELTRAADTEQLAFELIAFMETANATSVLHDDPAVYRRARQAILRALRHLATATAKLPAH